MLACGCTPTVGLATGFVAFPVLRSPAGSSWAGSCGFSSPLWFSTFAMGSPCGVEASFSSIGTKVWHVSLSLLGCFFVFPLSYVSGHLMRQVCWSVPTCTRTPVVSASPSRRWCVSWWSSLGSNVFGCSWLSPVFFPFRYYGSMSVFIAIPPGLGWSSVLCPRSFRIGFVPLSEVSPCTLQLAAHFPLVIHASASLHVFWPLS